MLRYGFRHDLEQSDLYASPSEADSERVFRQFTRYVHGMFTIIGQAMQAPSHMGLIEILVYVYIDVHVWEKYEANF